MHSRLKRDRVETRESGVPECGEPRAPRRGAGAWDGGESWITVCKKFLALCEGGAAVCKAGHTVCKVGHTVCKPGHAVCKSELQFVRPDRQFAN